MLELWKVIIRAGHRRLQSCISEKPKVTGQRGSFIQWGSNPHPINGRSVRIYVLEAKLGKLLTVLRTSDNAKTRCKPILAPLPDYREGISMSALQVVYGNVLGETDKGGSRRCRTPLATPSGVQIHPTAILLAEQL